MKRQVWIASLTLLLLLAGIALVSWNDKKNDSDINTARPAAKSLRIKRTGFADIALRRKAQGPWQISEPCLLNVNMQRLAPLLKALTNTSHQYLATEVDLDAAGLSTPKAVVVWNQQRIDIGGKDLSGERRYILLGESVQFAPEWVLSLINGGLTAIAAPELFNSTLSSISLINGKQSSELATDERLSWQNASAQQIVSWPDPSLGEPLDSQSMQAETDNGRKILNVHRYDNMIAVQMNNDACAYLLPGGDLPGFRAH